MAGCPLRNFEECPQHSKKGGCEWWLSYTTNSGLTDARVDGCAIVVQPMLMVENANVLGQMGNRVYQVAAEVSAGRAESVKEGDALRKQLLHLASGGKTLIVPDHNTTLPPAAKPNELEDHSEK